MAQITGKLTKDEDKKEVAAVSFKKALKNADTLTRAFAVGLKPLIAFANWSGGQFQSFIQAGGMYKFREFEKNNFKISTGIGLSTIEKGLIHLIHPLNEDVSEELRRKTAMKQGFIKWLSTWGFTDVMMSSNAFPERKLQYANVMSFNENSMVVDDRIVNIRQYLRKQDRENKYNLSSQERRSLEKTFESRVEELKSTKSLVKIAQIENDKVVIPGVSDEALAKYRVKIIEYNRTLNGQMSNDNKANYRRDTIFTSFMMFKTWMPKLVSARALDIHQNLETEEWEYGRTRVFVKTLVKLGARNIAKMRDMLNGTEEGLRIMDEMLEEKIQEHYKKTGQLLTITKEEFYDLIRQELVREIKELSLLVSLMGMIVAAKAAKPPEDATALEKNKYNFFAKAINKVTDEITFYYNPMSFEGMTRGSIMPSLSLLSKVEKLFTNVGKEATGYILNDEEMMKAAHPYKYFMNLVPIGAQLQTEVLPYIYPEFAKEIGIKVSSQSRGMRSR